MAKEKRQENRTGPEEVCPVLDKFGLVITLRSLIEESSSIAKYIDDTVQYGRALGYTEGRLAAYIEIVDRILEGDFDPDMFKGGWDGYEM